MDYRPRPLALQGIISACALLLIFGSALVHATSTAQGTLTVGHSIDPPGLNPFGHNAATFESITASTIEKLLYADASSPIIQPGLAHAWNWSDDALRLTLHLRQDVSFHNGEPFDAEAARFSLEQLMASTFLATFTNDLGLQRVVVDDPHTITLHFEQPAGNAEFVLARASFVVPPVYYEQVGAQGFASRPVGTGPYAFVEWVRDDRVVFEAFDGYWGDDPRLERIVWRIIPEASSRVAALEAGEVDLITDVVPGARSRIIGNPNLELVSRPGLRKFATFFEMRYDHPVADARVRRALNYAVDKSALVALFEGEATALEGQYLTEGILGFNPDVDPFHYDPDAARALLAEAGYPDGFAMTLKYTVGRYPLDREMGEVVAAYLEAVGIRVEQIPLDIVEFNRQHAEEETMGPAWQWGLLTPADPHMTLGLFRPGTFFQRYPDDPTIAELFAAGLREVDPTRRETIYQELVLRWNEDPLGIYTIVPNDLYAIRADVVGFVPRIDQVVDLRDVKLAGR